MNNKQSGSNETGRVPRTLNEAFGPYIYSHREHYKSDPQPMHPHDVIAAIGCTAAAVFLGLFLGGWL